jgi:hypothetical protein
MEQVSLSERLEGCGKTVIGQIDRYQPETPGGKFLQQCVSDAAGCAGDQGDFSCIAHGNSSLQ